MLKATTLSLLALGLAAGLSMTSADAATSHARVNCSLARNAGLPACEQAAQAQMAPDVAHTGTVVPALAPAYNGVKLDCDSVPQNMLEYYCNHRDEFQR
jgi:hypothetical protein